MLLKFCRESVSSLSLLSLCGLSDMIPWWGTMPMQLWHCLHTGLAFFSLSFGLTFGLSMSVTKCFIFSRSPHLSLSFHAYNCLSLCFHGCTLWHVMSCLLSLAGRQRGYLSWGAVPWLQFKPGIHLLRSIFMPTFSWYSTGTVDNMISSLWFSLCGVS